MWFKIKQITNRMLDVVYPTDFRCVVCGAEIPSPQEIPICENCGIVYNVGHICAHCGRPLENESNFCENCIAHPYDHFDFARSALVYEGSTVKMIRAWKFGGKRYILSAIQPIFNRFLSTITEKPNVIVPVPLDTKKLRKRGFNQAQELAEIASRHFDGVPIVSALSKVKSIKDQARLNAESRALNVKDRFSLCEKESNEGQTVLLIDDVMTTGATIRECARILSKGKPAKIFAVTLASVRYRLH